MAPPGAAQPAREGTGSNSAVRPVVAGHAQTNRRTAPKDRPADPPTLSPATGTPATATADRPGPQRRDPATATDRNPPPRTTQPQRHKRPSAAGGTRKTGTATAGPAGPPHENGKRNAPRDTPTNRQRRSQTTQPPPRAANGHERAGEGPRGQGRDGRRTRPAAQPGQDSPGRLVAGDTPDKMKRRARAAASGRATGRPRTTPATGTV